jgi:hypothetical protein
MDPSRLTTVTNGVARVGGFTLVVNFSQRKASEDPSLTESLMFWKVLRTLNSKGALYSGSAGEVPLSQPSCSARTYGIM